VFSQGFEAEARR